MEENKSETTRKLATLRRIDRILPHTNADKLELAVVGGWQCVVKKEEFKAGDLVIYFEVDSWVPNHIAPFLTKPGKMARMYNGVPGERLRTVRLRGELSQGLVLPVSELFDPFFVETDDGYDLTAILGVQKWERPLPGCLQGVARGNFPPFIHKTDQERIQNISKVLRDVSTVYEITLKLDGSSITIYKNGDTVGVCSRNFDLDLDGDSHFVAAAKASGVLDALTSFDRNFAIQGELMGPGIQGNREGFENHRIYVFDIWDIDKQQYMPLQERGTLLYDIWRKASRFAETPLEIVPIAVPVQTLQDLEISTPEMTDTYSAMQAILELPRRFGEIVFPNWTQPIEGIVFKAVDGTGSFKVINNDFLEREK